MASDRRHVEDGETAAETAVRATLEEAGMRARLLSLPLPVEFLHQPVPAAWWTVEMPACADNHTPVEHVHVDHVFVADVESPASGVAAECEVRWFTGDGLARDPEVADDSRMQALQIWALLDQPAQLTTV